MSWQWFSTYLLSLGIFLLWNLVVLFRAQLGNGWWFSIQQLTFHAVFVEQNEWGYYPAMITLLCLIFGQRCKDAIWMVFLQWTAALYVCKMTIRKTFVNWGFVVKRERKKETAVPPLHTVRSCVGLRAMFSTAVTQASIAPLLPALPDTSSKQDPVWHQAAYVSLRISNVRASICRSVT